jgi:hypothetical protein
MENRSNKSTLSAELGLSTETVRPPSPMEFGSMPLDPLYAWGIRYEPIEVLIKRTAAYIEELAQEAYQGDKVYTEKEIIKRFQAFFQDLVDENILIKHELSSEERKRWKIVRPKQWAQAQNARIKRIVEWWKTQDKVVNHPPAMKG